MATATAPPEYLLGDAADERTRLMAQAALLEDEARALLDRVDIPVGGDVIDIGCGPIGVLPLLSDRVGPHGQVTGSTATATCSTTPLARAPASATSAPPRRRH